jgi:hypothetical protein
VSFEDVIRRQLDLFVEESADLIAACEDAERAYDAAGRDEAEEKYGEYLDLVETGTERLAAMDEAAAEQYEHEFNHAVQVRLPRFALGIENA